MLPHFEPFGNHSFSASPPPVSPGPVTLWRRCRYRPRLTVVTRSARGLVGLSRVPLSLQVTCRLPTRLATPHLHVAWTVLNVLHQTGCGLRRETVRGLRRGRTLLVHSQALWKAIMPPKWKGQRGRCHGVAHGTAMVLDMQRLRLHQQRQTVRGLRRDGTWFEERQHNIRHCFSRTHIIWTVKRLPKDSTHTRV